MAANENKAKQAERFSRWLRSEMVARNLSKRALGKMLDPENPVRGRRQVLRHTSVSKPHYPSSESRSRYTEIFGPLPVEFRDDDDEEAEPVSLVAELHELARSHRETQKRLERLQRIVRADYRSVGA